ncbi:MAG: transglutaminase domain-containing protein, partial [Chloroflexota bacterium]
LGEEIAADAMDVAGDRLVASRSLAIQLGGERALRISAAIFLTVIVMTGLPFLLGWLDWIFLLPFLLVDGVILYATRKLLDARIANRRQYIRWIYLSGLGMLIIFILMGLITGQLSPRNGSSFSDAQAETEASYHQALAAEIIGAETDIVAIAQKSAAWTAQNIAYDNRLAQQIWNGRIDSLSALETLDRGAGTCSEYTNLFIAIMRSQGIPARFVTGVIYGGSYHAWPEFYLYDVGWIPVEAQGGFVGTTTRHIKLLAGLDFVDIGVKLKDIRASATRLEE